MFLCAWNKMNKKMKETNYAEIQLPKICDIVI